MSASKIVLTGDGQAVIEVFDYSSEFSFDEFCDWVSTVLGVEIGPKRRLAPRKFEFNGESFRCAWNDEFGSHIASLGTLRSLLERIQQIFSQNDPD